MRDLRLGGSGTERALLFHLLVNWLLTQHATRQEKQLYIEVGELDSVAPEGLDEQEGPTVIEIKYGGDFRMWRTGADFLRHAVVDYNARSSMLILSVNPTKSDIARIERVYGNTKIPIRVVGLEYMQKLYRQYKKRLEPFISVAPPDVLQLLEDPAAIGWLNERSYESITSQDKSDDAKRWTDYRKKYVASLRQDYQNGMMVLFLGAGISNDSGVPDLDELLRRLKKEVAAEWLSKEKLENNEENTTQALEVLDSVLDQDFQLASLFYEQELSASFIDILGRVLYRGATGPAPNIQDIAQLCQNTGAGLAGVKAVITYNYDNLLEQALDALTIAYESISKKEERPGPNRMPVYHVHGYLPRADTGAIGAPEGDLVLSERGYFIFARDPFHWANTTQLHYLRENTCLMVGFSMTDPDLRRLLRIAQENQGEPRHYAIIKKQVGRDNPIHNRLLNTYQRGLERSLKDLGIRIIWISGFKEISGIIADMLS